MEKQLEKDIRNVFPFVINLQACSVRGLWTLEEKFNEDFIVFKSNKMKDKMFCKSFFGKTFPDVENVSKELGETEGIIMFLTPKKEKKNQAKLFLKAERVLETLNGVHYPLTWNDWRHMCSNVIPTEILKTTI